MIGITSSRGTTNALKKKNYQQIIDKALQWKWNVFACSKCQNVLSYIYFVYIWGYAKEKIYLRKATTGNLREAMESFTPAPKMSLIAPDFTQQ